MNQIENQRKVIDQLYQIFACSSPQGVGEAKCRFDYQHFEDGCSSVGQQFAYKQGVKKSQQP